MIGRCAVSLIGAVLAGCAAQGGVITHSERYPAYTGAVMRYAAGGRDLLVEILGNPTTLAEAEFGHAVPRAMQTAFGGNTRFTTTPDAGARLNFRVVLLFGAATDSNGHSLCAGDPMRAAPPGPSGHLRLQAAFCQRHTVLSEVVGEAPAPALSQLIERVTLALLPAERPGEPQGSSGYILERLIFGN